MNFDRFLPVKLKEFFHQHPVSEPLKYVHILILRRDGVILYSNAEGIDKNTAGALMGGVWQAVDALMALIPHSQEKDIYRLSFDTSSKGIYMLPFKVCQQEYYLSIIYSNQTNPALIKSKIRKLAQNLSHSMTQSFSYGHDDKNKNVPEENFLFRDLSDAEMDSLFSFASS